MVKEGFKNDNIFFWIGGFMCFIILVIAICTHDYTKDEKGEDKKEKIDDYLLK